MAPTDDGLTPRIGHTGNMDAKTFILGQGNVMGKEYIQDFFNCVGKLSLDDAPILKSTRSYADAISALVVKLESKFIRTHPTLQRLFFELPVIKNPRAKKLATLILMNEFDYIIWEARKILGMLRFLWIICFMLCLQIHMMKAPLRRLRRKITKLRSLFYA